MSSSSGSEATTQSKIREIIAPTAMSIVGTMIALFPSNPGNVTLPSRDSGVFLYAAA